jgi:hypothetical protein
MSKWVRLGHSAMSAPVSALPESGHGWTIYEYTSWLNSIRFGMIRTGMDHQTAYCVVGGLRTDVRNAPPGNARRQGSY